MRAPLFAGVLGLVLVTSCAKIFGVDDPGIEADGGAGQPCDLQSNNPTPCAPGFVCLPSYMNGQGNVCSPQCTADSQCPPGQGCLAVSPMGMGNNMAVLACAPNACGSSGSCNYGNGGSSCMNGVCRNTCGSNNMDGFGALGCPSDETCMIPCPNCGTGTCEPADGGGGSGSSSGSAGSGSGSSSGGSSSGGDGGLPAPDIIASNRQGPFALAVSGGNVFWTENNGSNGVWACPVTGCPATITPFPGFNGNPTGIAVLNVSGLTAVVWGDIQGFSIYMCPYVAGTGCSMATKIVSNSQAPFGIATDSSGTVYWAESQGGGSGGLGAVKKCLPVGDGGTITCTPVDLGLGPQASAPAMVASNSLQMFWANSLPQPMGSSTMAMAAECSQNGCGSQELVLAQVVNAPHGIQGIDAGNGTFYFTTEGGRFAWRAMGTTPVQIGDTGTAGPTSSSNMGRFLPAGIASDARNVYWASLGTRQIVYCPVAGCGTGVAPTPLANLGSNTPTGASLVVDSGYVYWADHTGGIVARIAAPL